MAMTNKELPQCGAKTTKLNRLREARCECIDQSIRIKEKACKLADVILEGSRPENVHTEHGFATPIMNKSEDKGSVGLIQEMIEGFSIVTRKLQAAEEELDHILSELS